MSGAAFATVRVFAGSRSGLGLIAQCRYALVSKLSLVGGRGDRISHQA